MCDEQFIDEEVFKIHIKTNHQSMAEYQCNKCDNFCTEENELGNHLKSAHELEDFKCEECNQAFTSEKALKVHEKKEHERCPMNSTFFNPSLVKSD